VASLLFCATSVNTGSICRLTLHMTTPPPGNHTVTHWHWYWVNRYASIPPVRKVSPHTRNAARPPILTWTQKSCLQRHRPLDIHVTARLGKPSRARKLALHQYQYTSQKNFLKTTSKPRLAGLLLAIEELTNHEYIMFHCQRIMSSHT